MASTTARKGECRLCFEGSESGELIAPCSCSGGSKWIHRKCLDRWRTTGSNRRAMTHCPSCGVQYRLKLNRCLDEDKKQERKQRFMQLLATQTLGLYLLSQAAIIGLALLIRAADAKEKLVEVFGLPQHKGYDEPGDFETALKHHKLTYYLAGVLVLLAIAGISTTIDAMLGCCRGRSRQAGASPCDCGDCSYVTCHGESLCGDCGICCWACSEHCCKDTRSGCEACTCDVCSGGCDGDNPLVILLVIVLLVFVIVGLFAACVAVVTASQKALQKWAQLQQLGFLTKEYVVEDLADPADFGDHYDPEVATAPVQDGMKEPAEQDLAARPLSTEQLLEQESLHRLITEDIMQIYGLDVGQAAQRTHGGARSYGSTEATA